MSQNPIFFQTIVPEQEQATEATDYDIELFSTKELAYHFTLFDWDLFWCVHEVSDLISYELQ